MNNSVKNTVSRRKFLQYSGLTGAALILGVSGNHASGATTVTNLSNLDEGYNLSPYVIIEKSGKITIFNTKPEMGQGTFQSIPALIAEELELAPGQFTVLQTGGEKKFGNEQAAGGSYSVRSSYETLRRWELPPARCLFPQLRSNGMCRQKNVMPNSAGFFTNHRAGASATGNWWKLPPPWMHPKIRA